MSQLLSPEENRYYDDFDDMFATAGWKRLIQEVKEEIFNLQADALDLPSWDRVKENKGRALQLAYMLGYENVLRNQKSNRILDLEADEIDDAAV
jgi:hypothetical protein